MSQTQTADDVTDPPPGATADDTVERVARLNGWKPQAEYKGPPDKWIPAADFVARGLENPAMLRDRNNVLTERLDRLERVHRDETKALQAKIEESTGTVLTMTQMMRSAEQRAYDRAKRELESQRDAAVAGADTETFKRVDADLRDLETTKPTPPAAATPPAATTPPPAAAAPTELDPAVRSFYERNPWYDQSRTRADRDDEMMRYADTVYAGLRSTEPNLSLQQNLERVDAEVRLRFPSKFQRAAPVSERNQDTPADDRRDEPASVTPSNGGGGARRPVQRFTFDSMPKESKDAYAKYAKQLEGKGAPLTKDEWATTYWEQFQDNGA